jgi:hypothetical protein
VVSQVEHGDDVRVGTEAAHGLSLAGPSWCGSGR